MKSLVTSLSKSGWNYSMFKQKENSVSYKGSSVGLSACPACMQAADHRH